MSWTLCWSLLHTWAVQVSDRRPTHTAVSDRRRLLFRITAQRQGRKNRPCQHHVANLHLHHTVCSLQCEYDKQVSVFYRLPLYLWWPGSLRSAQTVWWGSGRGGSSRVPRWQLGSLGLSRSRRAAEPGGGDWSPGSGAAHGPPPTRGRGGRWYRTLPALQEWHNQKF